MAGSLTLNLSYRNPITDALESNPLVAPVGSWRIAAPYRADETLPMVAVHPLAAADATAAWRWFTTKTDNSIRLAWQGGEPPFRIEMTTSPTGATIGNSGTTQEFVRTADASVSGLYRHALPTSYATVKMPAASVTNLTAYNFVITVTDQNDVVLTYTFTVNADDSKFKFFDAVSGNNANPGTFESPFQTFLHGYDLASAGSYIYMFKNGTYTVTNGTSGDAAISDTHSRSLIGIGTDRSTVSLSMATDALSGAVSDWTIKNMTVTGANPALANPKQIAFTGQSDRAHICGVSFDTRVGTLGDDNPCGIFFADLGSGSYHQHLSIVDCELLPTSESSLVVYFTPQYSIEENCTASGVAFPQVNGSLVSHQKARSSNTTYRFCDYSADSPNGIIWVSNQAADDCENNEIVYCRLENIGSGNDSVLRFNGQALVGARPPGQLAVRNSIIAGSSDPFTFEAYIAGDDVSYSASLWSSSVATVIDATGGTSLATASTKVADVNTLAEANLGIRGWIIASTEVV